jgi:hypothetical protein
MAQLFSFLLIEKCFDYDWGLQDDFMGATKLTLTQLDLSQSEEMFLKLTDPARPAKDLGELKIVATLTPKSQEDKEQVSEARSMIRNKKIFL